MYKLNVSVQDHAGGREVKILFWNKAKVFYMRRREIDPNPPDTVSENDKEVPRCKEQDVLVGSTVVFIPRLCGTVKSSHIHPELLLNVDTTDTVSRVLEK